MAADPPKPECSSSKAPLEYEKPMKRVSWRPYVIAIGITAGTFVVCGVAEFIRVSHDTGFDEVLGIPARMTLSSRLFWAAIGALCPAMGAAVVTMLGLLVYLGVRERR